MFVGTKFFCIFLTWHAEMGHLLLSASYQHNLAFWLAKAFSIVTGQISLLAQRRKMCNYTWHLYYLAVLRNVKLKIGRLVAEATLSWKEVIQFNTQTMQQFEQIIRERHKTTSSSAFSSCQCTSSDVKQELPALRHVDKMKTYKDTMTQDKKNTKTQLWLEREKPPFFLNIFLPPFFLALTEQNEWNIDSSHPHLSCACKF